MILQYPNACDLLNLPTPKENIMYVHAQQGLLEGTAAVPPPYESLRMMLESFLGLYTSPATAQLELMTATKVDWIALGEEPPNQIAWAKAARILDIAHSMRLDPAYVTASSSGGVGIVYGPPDNSYAAIECLNTGDIWSLWYDAKDEPRTRQIADSIPAITDALIGVERLLNA